MKRFFLFQPFFYEKSFFFLTAQQIIRCREQKAKPLKLVRTRLFSKYETPFSFYRVKPINQMLYGYYHRPTHIRLSDIRIYSQQAQFMRRVYYYQTATGRQQIMQRIKMCGQYYAKNTMLTYEHPMMILTNTKNLFLKRHHRLRKIQAGEASSDQSEEEERLLDPLEEYDILEDLERSSIDDIESEYIDEQASFDSSQHDVFQSIVPRQQQTALNLKAINEQDIKHLVSDLDQKSFRQTEPWQLSRIAINTLQNIENKVTTKKEDSVSITPINDSKSSVKLITAPSKGISFSRLGLKIQGVLQNCRRQGQSMTIDTFQLKEDTERLQLSNRRRKIRQKAEQLLKKVRKQQNALQLLN